MRFGFAQALSMMLWLAVAICWLEALLYRIEALLPMVLVLMFMPQGLFGKSLP